MGGLPISRMFCGSIRTVTMLGVGVPGLSKLPPTVSPLLNPTVGAVLPGIYWVVGNEEMVYTA